MARIPDEVVNRLKMVVSLLRLAESQGHQPKKQGKDWAIRYPFHDRDDTPSLIISPKSNLFRCFGCDAAGSVIDWVMKTQGRASASRVKSSRTTPVWWRKVRSR